MVALAHLPSYPSVNTILACLYEGLNTLEVMLGYLKHNWLPGVSAQRDDIP